MPPLSSRRLTLAALFCGLLAAAGRSAEATPPAEAVQMLADITLIDGQCRQVEVNFGRAFEAAANMGVRPSDVMPAGAFRAAFEAAARNRLARTMPEELCGDVAQAYADHVPGILRRR